MNEILNHKNVDTKIILLRNKQCQAGYVTYGLYSGGITIVQSAHHYSARPGMLRMDYILEV